MAKLHELLAVEADLKGGAQRSLNQILALFKDGTARLIGSTKSYKPLYEDGDDFADDVVNLATTVPDELTAFHEAYGAWMDVAFQKEVTNQKARADVIIDDKIVLKNVPATALLNLEAKLAEVRRVYVAIPTNDPAEEWTYNEQTGQWESPVRTTYRTKKERRAVILYEATPEHPAQVEAFNEDVRVGSWTSVIRTGMLSPSEKKRQLNRLDTLLRAVKQARQRANDIDAETRLVGELLFGYISGQVTIE